MKKNPMKETEKEFSATQTESKDGVALLKPREESQPLREECGRLSQCGYKARTELIPLVTLVKRDPVE